MQISTLYQIYKSHPQVCTDTRNIIPQSLFFCLKGERFNGNLFAQAALEKGAAYVLTEEPQSREDERFIIVDNVLETLQKLAQYHRLQLDIPVIGITGTNGKTTTKELVTAVLSKNYRVTATQGNLNNHIGVPLTLLSIPQDAEMAVVEMGANHPHEIAELCRLSQPNFGLITNIGKAHLEGFGNVETIIATKTALYEAVRQRQGTLFVHADDTLLMQQSEGCRRFTYGSGASADVKGELLPGSVQMCFNENVGGGRVQTQLVGDYNFPNAMAALAVGCYFNVGLEQCRAALTDYEPGNGRSQILKKGKIHFIIDAYNANPSSMSLAIRNMAQLSSEHKVLVLGDMRELGLESLREHQQMVDLIESLHFESVFLLGDEFGKTTAPDSWKFSTMEALKDALKSCLQHKNASVLVKGSRGMRMERVLEYF
ncbi:MAG: UDP-N-acetylmuramoyl-tripeptide--D-alanyl-D-alanine ligase [Bacteroidales bacterium]|nr:UDP-N-acetylmuramoyl-tripeptide--D-alanyl-D-alanine ligase [Bacteroidales bacterium]